MMKAFLNKGVAVLFGGLLFCASCGDADLFDTNKWSDKIDGWEPSVKATIANGSFSMWDLLKDTAKDAPIQNEDGMLVIKYVKENIYVQDDLSKIFNLPLKNVSIAVPAIDIPGDLQPDIPINGNKPLPEMGEETELQGIPGECELREIMFDADLDITLPRLEHCDYSVIINITNVYSNENDGNSYSRLITVYRGFDVFSENIPLNNALVKLGADRKISLTVNATLLSGGTVSAGSSINGITVKLSNLAFIKAIGKVVIEPMEVAGSFDMDIDFLNELGGKFTFNKPELNLIVRNKGIGVKTALNMSLWVNDGAKEGDRFDGVKLPLEGNVDNTLKIMPIIGYSGETYPALAKFLSLPPKGEIHYAGKVGVDESVDGVIWSDGRIEMDAQIRIPLSLSAEGLTYCDTIKDVDIDSKIAEKLKSGSIQIFAKENQIPLDLTISKLILVDENYNELSTIEEGADKSIKGNSKGEKVELKLSENNIKDLAKMKHILMEITASTGGNVVSILANANLTFSLSITAQAQITDTNF